MYALEAAMPSTYSPLKLELIATGEKSNLWGDITNQNMAVALERAITGMAVVNFPSNAQVILDYQEQSPPQPQQFRNLVLRLTGALTSPQNLIVPAIEKFYIIWNETGQAITVKTAAGTGVAVPVGDKYAVFVDGTNVSFAFKTVVNLATETTGTLAVNRGGTGATSLTGFVKGNGTNAFTASSAVDLSSETTGTLPVSRGGTGATTLTGVVKGSGTSALTAGTVNLATEVSGVLGHTNGGTGTNSLSQGMRNFLASPSSDNLASIVSSTGTGNYVRDNDPTLYGVVSLAPNASLNVGSFSTLFASRPIRYTSSLQVGNTIDMTLGSYIRLVNPSTGAITFLNQPFQHSVRLEVSVDVTAGSATLTWPTTIRWAGGAPPSTLANGSSYIFRFSTNGFDNKIIGQYLGPVAL
jgi:hypothetical protein